MNKDLIFDIWLSQVFMHKNINVGNLIKEFGSAKEVFIRGSKEIDLSLYSNTVKSAFMLQDLTLAKDVFDDCVKNEIEILSYADENYPENLKEIDTPPACLYYKGNISKLSKPLITIVGERHPTSEGRGNASYFATEMEKAGICVVTGFADGIEAEVLKNALEPVTILPCGVKKASPKSNVKHLTRIIENGGLCITEYPSMHTAQPYNYRHRNRLLAGISDSTLVIEAGIPSGTAMTVNFASIYDKEVYVLPGSINSKHYKGNLKYIKDGALMVTHPSEIVYDYYMKYPGIVTDFEEKEDVSSNLDETEKKIVTALCDKSCSIDEISILTGVSVREINASVISLEMSGYIKCISPDVYALSK